MSANLKPPSIVQGGMGVRISGWPLARAVSMLGQRGTVSGVFLEGILARTLQIGDPGGHIRRAFDHFPFPAVSEKVWKAFYVNGGIPKGTPFKSIPMFTIDPPESLISLVICANFAFVWLAKEGHDNPVGINYLEKVAIPHVYAIVGAMLADVDYIYMGAGIPDQIPAVIDAILAGKTAIYKVPVIGRITGHTVSFNSEQFFGAKLPLRHRPSFIPIISSSLLGTVLMRLLPETGRIQEFVVEEPSAGGHNAPPRKTVLNEQGKLPIYGEKDLVDYVKIAKLGLPFWIGGSCASPEKLKWALSVGAQGIQVGSAFALCEESGMDPELRKRVRALGYAGELEVRTDMRFSSTGFPFKVAVLEGTLSDPVLRDGRLHICNHGGLVSLYEKADGSIGYRCAGEPVDAFVEKGGNPDDTVERGCLCNALIATTGLGNPGEIPIITLGDDPTVFLLHLMKNAESSYSASDVIRYILSGV